MRYLAAILFVLLLPLPAPALVGQSFDSFSSGTLIHQLQLTSRGASAFSGRTLHRFVSDDGVITVDIVVSGNTIEQQVMYVPMDIQRAYQVTFFLQDAVGSLVGAQKGMIAYRAAVSNRTETHLPFGPLTMRFTPLNAGQIRVLVSR